MKLLGINDGSDHLSEVPKPPVYLTDSAKEHYKAMAKKLIKHKRLKDIYLDALEAYASAKARWEFACRKIRELDKEEYGSGYFQSFKNGTVTQNSTWVNQQNQAWAIIEKCCKMFGLDPASEQGLTVDPNQGNLFDDLAKKLKGA